MNLLYPACLLAGIAATWLAVSVFYAFRKANRVIREAPVPPSNVRPLTSRHGVRVVPQSRRWEA